MIYGLPERGGRRSTRAAIREMYDLGVHGKGIQRSGFRQDLAARGVPERDREGRLGTRERGNDANGKLHPSRLPQTPGRPYRAS